MPLEPTIISGAILTANPNLTGPTWLQFVALLSAAIAAWAQTPGNIVVNGVTTGAIGSGTVTGKLAVKPDPLPITSAEGAALLVGIVAPQVALAIGVGVANAFTAQAAYAGVSTGVGAGTDAVVGVVPNPATLTASITAVMASAGFVGVSVPQMAAALGIGIAGLLASGTTGVGAVTGVGGPSPAGGTSVSQVV